MTIGWLTMQTGSLRGRWAVFAVAVAVEVAWLAALAWLAWRT